MICLDGSTPHCPFRTPPSYTAQVSLELTELPKRILITPDSTAYALVAAIPHYTQHMMLVVYFARDTDKPLKGTAHATPRPVIPFLGQRTREHLRRAVVLSTRASKQQI